MQEFWHGRIWALREKWKSRDLKNLFDFGALFIALMRNIIGLIQTQITLLFRHVKDLSVNKLFGYKMV